LMSLKSKFCLLAVAALAFNVSAQFSSLNARIGAMGGTYIVDDINDVLRYAAYMNNYGDDAQVTFNTPIIGIKSLGDMVNLGISANRGLVLDPSFTNGFYEAALANVNPVAEPDIANPVNIPHVLLGLNLGAVSLGFDLFCEYGRTSSSSETAAGASTEAGGLILNPGVIASLLLGSETLPLAFKFGISVPVAKGHSETTPAAGGATTKTEVSSEGALFLEVGAEAAVPMGNFNLDLGTDFIMEKYSFETGNVDANDNTNFKTSVYAGADAKVFENGVFGIMYDFQLRSHTLTTPADAKTNTKTITQFFRTGLENVWENVWVLDKVAARGGAVWALTTPTAKADDDAGNEGRAKAQTAVSELIPTVGLGAGKGPFELDMTINLGSWANGLFGGPSVGSVTAGLRF